MKIEGIITCDGCGEPPEPFIYKACSNCGSQNYTATCTIKPPQALEFINITLTLDLPKEDE